MAVSGMASTGAESFLRLIKCRGVFNSIYVSSQNSPQKSRFDKDNCLSTEPAFLIRQKRKPANSKRPITSFKQSLPCPAYARAPLDKSCGYEYSWASIPRTHHHQCIPWPAPKT